MVEFLFHYPNIDEKIPSELLKIYHPCIHIVADELSGYAGDIIGGISGSRYGLKLLGV
jgi:hypothetical protein